MSSFKQVEANRANARKSTGPRTLEGKQQSRCNAVRHGLTAETVIGALEDAQDYQAFEAAVIADYDAQSAVERELVLRLASLLWRLRRASTMETGLFAIQADQLRDLHNAQNQPGSGEDVQPLLVPPAASTDEAMAVSNPGNSATADEPIATSDIAAATLPADAEYFALPENQAAELARCFLRLANLPNFALDRLSRYEAALWRQAGQILLTLDTLDRRKPQERRGRLNWHQW